MNKGNGKIVLTFFFGLVIGLALGYFVFEGQIRVLRSQVDNLQADKIKL